jgi:hypothetical protein
MNAVDAAQPLKLQFSYKCKIIGMRVVEHIALSRHYLHGVRKYQADEVFCALLICVAPNSQSEEKVR